MTDEKYNIKIIMRDGGGQTYDDYHATVTRLSDGEVLLWVNRWKWVLKLHLRRKNLDKQFAIYDKTKAKLAQKEEYKL
jgi:hypothetical protein